MGNLTIRISAYTKTILVYVNNQLIEGSSRINDINYTSTVNPGLHEIRIIKGSEVLSSHWKKKVALDWLSCLSGIPDFTLREAMLEANISSICFNVNTTKQEKDNNIRVILNISGFEIIDGMEICENIQSENKTDNTAIKRIKRFYLLPVALLAVVIVGLLIGLATFFAIKGRIQLFFIVSALIIILSTLFIFMYKKSME